MHEMSYISRMISLAAEVAEENNAKTVRKIVIEVGKSSGVMPYYMHKYYPEASKGTILEGAELICEEVPVKAHCEECDKDYFPVRDNRYLCPFCGGRVARIIARRYVALKNVIIEG